MNGRRAEIEPLLEAILGGLAQGCAAEVVLCPPCIYLPLISERLQGSRVVLGAQNLALEERGAYTGEVSGRMLKEYDCRYVIVGHSERRALYGEHDALVADKVARALSSALVPILCVGETLAEREAGRTTEVVSRQIDAVLARAGVTVLSDAVVAYEPVWAIGTGKTASPEQAQAVHALIRARVSAAAPEAGQRLPILYGGSVRAANAPSLFAMPDIDGGLVGGASLQGAEFAAICRAA